MRVRIRARSSKHMSTVQRKQVGIQALASSKHYKHGLANMGVVGHGGGPGGLTGPQEQVVVDTSAGTAFALTGFNFNHIIILL